MVHECTGYFHAVACLRQPAESSVGPRVATYHCQRVGEGGYGLGVPSGLADRGGGVGQRSVGLQGHQGEETQQGRSGAQDGALRPSRAASRRPDGCALRGTSLRPASATRRRTNQARMCSGSASRSVHSRAWVRKVPCGSRMSTGADRHRREARRGPHGRLREHLDGAIACAVPVGDRAGGPHRLRVLEVVRQVGEARAYQPRAALLMWQARRRRSEQACIFGIEAQAGDDGRHRADRIQQLPCRRGAVPHHDERPCGLPARHLAHQLPCPGRQGFVPAALPLGRALGRRRAQSERARPRPALPTARARAAGGRPSAAHAPARHGGGSRARGRARCQPPRSACRGGARVVSSMPSTSGPGGTNGATRRPSKRRLALRLDQRARCKTRWSA